MHCVIETESYLRAAKDAGLCDNDRNRIVQHLSDNPESGDIIKGTGGARKTRFPFRNKGKSGGVRVITYYATEDVPVFLLDVFSKGDRIDISQSERNELKRILSEMVDSYRETNKNKIADLVEKSA